jgi:hypothetical protein
VVTLNTQVPCDQIKKKIRVGENGGLNQSKHQNSTIQVTRFFFLIDHLTYTSTVHSQLISTSILSNYTILRDLLLNFGFVEILAIFVAPQLQ